MDNIGNELWIPFKMTTMAKKIKTFQVFLNEKLIKCIEMWCGVIMEMLLSLLFLVALLVMMR